VAIFIKRFRVRYNGVTYGPGQPGGQIISGLSNEEEARLIEHSMGNIERYPNSARGGSSDRENNASDSMEKEPANDVDVDTVQEDPVFGEDAEPVIESIRAEDFIKPRHGTESQKGRNEKAGKGR